MDQEFENRWRGIKVILAVTSDPPAVEYVNPCVLNEQEERVAWKALRDWVRDNAERLGDE